MCGTRLSRLGGIEPIGVGNELVPIFEQPQALPPTPPLCDINIRGLRSCKIWDNNNNNTTKVSITDTVEVRMPTCSSEKDGEHHVLFRGSPIQRIPAIRNILPKFLVPLPIHILYCLTAAF